MAPSPPALAGRGADDGGGRVLVEPATLSRDGEEDGVVVTDLTSFDPILAAATSDDTRASAPGSASVSTTRSRRGSSVSRGSALEWLAADGKAGIGGFKRSRPTVSRLDVAPPSRPG